MPSKQNSIRPGTRKPQEFGQNLQRRLCHSGLKVADVAVFATQGQAFRSQQKDVVQTQNANLLDVPSEERVQNRMCEGSGAFS
jgi:hypothetical protein